MRLALLHGETIVPQKHIEFCTWIDCHLAFKIKVARDPSMARDQSACFIDSFTTRLKGIESSVMTIETAAILFFLALMFLGAVVTHSNRRIHPLSIDYKSEWILRLTVVFAFLMSTFAKGLGLANINFGLEVQVFGFMTMIAGASICIACLRVTNFSQTTCAGPSSIRHFEVAGIFRYVRHPKYFGTWIIFLGLSVVLANGIAIAMLSVVTVPAFLHRIHVEEKVRYHNVFEFGEYCLKVKKFFPLIW